MSADVSEKIGIDTINSFFTRSNKVTTWISFGDREPMWDGGLYLYNDKSGGNVKSNETFVGRLPCQIKGKKVKKIKKKLSFPVELTNLKQYRRDGGVLYFVVQYTDTEQQICYAELSPLKLYGLITGAAPHHTTKNITLLPFPAKLEDAEKLLITMWHTFNRQGVLKSNDPINIADLQKMGAVGFSVIVSNYDKSASKIAIITGQPVDLYARFDNGIPDLPIGGGPFMLSAKSKFYEDIKVGDKQYFDSYEKEASADEYTITFGDCAKIVVPRDKDVKKIDLTFSFNSETGLDKALHILEFITAVYDRQEIAIGDKTFGLAKPKKKNKSQADIHQLLEQHRQLKETMTQLQVNEDFDMKGLSDDDDHWLNFLVGATHDDIGQASVEGVNGAVKIKIGNQSLLVAVLNSNGKAKVYSAFDKEIGMESFYKYPDGKLPEPLFTAFSAQDFVDFVNVPYSEIVTSYASLKDKNKYIFTNLNMVGLNLIAAFDRLTDESLRKPMMADAVLEIFQWLRHNDPSSTEQKIYQLNEYQMLKRLGKLGDNETKQLNGWLYDTALDATIKCGAALLTDNHHAFEHYWATLTPEQQNTFKSFPIWKFAQLQ